MNLKLKMNSLLRCILTLAENELPQKSGVDELGWFITITQ